MGLLSGPETGPVIIRKYKNENDYIKDAREMIRRGYSPQGVMTHQGKIAAGRTALKAITFLPWAMLRPSHKADEVTVTWVKP